jgi:hypothetical protein
MEAALTITPTPKTTGRALRDLRESCHCCPRCSIVEGEQNEGKMSLRRQWRVRSRRVMGGRVLLRGGRRYVSYLCCRLSGC